MSHLEAKQFFVDKILLQAQKKQVGLTDAEKYMLWWSESDPNFESDESLNKHFKQNTDDEEYEKRIVGLIKEAYEDDVKNNSLMKNQYKDAYKTLKQQDDYVFVMIDQAIGKRMRWWFW